MAIEVLHRHIVVTCRRDGETVEIWIPADAGQGDKPDTAKPFIVPQGGSLHAMPRDGCLCRVCRARPLTADELRVVERI